jgi:signal recognition particle subunit SRP54
MFSSLSDNLSKIFDKLRGRGVLTVEDIDAAMREIRIALLEADVAVPTVKTLTQKIKERAVGAEVIKSITPGQMVVKIVQDELELILTSDKQDISLSHPIPIVIMMVGLQGSGKTTSSAKLALHLRKKYKKKSILASLDIYRPAAQLQLENVAKQIGEASLPIIENQSVEEITKRALKEASLGGYDVLILDTAGRIHTDEGMMDELKLVTEISKPHEILLALDSMTGQDAVNIGKEFSATLPLTGVILTRVDGDSRGGAALSMRDVTGVPIKFIGVGEKVSEFQSFDPKGAASRILGMGDIAALVERASENINESEANDMAKKLQTGQFNMNDLLKQLQSVEKMGGIASMIGMIPGMGKIKSAIGDISNSGSILKKYESIIRSMTEKERKNPKIINASRKIRISNGSGRKVQDVNKLLKQWLEMQNMMKKFGKMDPSKLGRMLGAIK